MGVVVGMRIDKARRNNEIGGVDDARGSVRDSVRFLAYLDDTTGPDGQVGTKSGLPAAINEGAVFYE